jgi:hypothetical protein
MIFRPAFSDADNKIMHAIYESVFTDLKELYKAMACFAHNNNIVKEIACRMIKEISENYCKLVYKKEYDDNLVSYKLFLESMIFNNVQFEKISNGYLESEYINDNNQTIIIKMLDKYCFMFEKKK